MGLGDRSMRKSYYPELRQRLAEIEHAGEFLHSLVDAMPSMLACVDRELRLTLVNVLFAGVTGVDPDAVKGRLFSEVLPWLPEIPAALEGVLRDKEPRVLRKMPGAGPDSPGWYDATIFPLGRDEAAVRIDDVTARVRMEEMLVQTEKTLSVGALAAGMAHEINNPLAGILQGVQSVLRRFEPDLEANKAAARRVGADLAAVNAYLDERGIPAMLLGVKEAGVRASRIVSSILEFSRRSDASRALVPLTTLVDKALELAVNEFDLQKKYDFRHIRISREDAPALPSVWCVPTQIEQVVLNLVKNAAQAMAQANIPDPAIAIRIGESGSLAFIEVSDNGPGMDDATRQRVLEPFFTTKAPGEGTGLGLSVVYYIVVEQHGGRVAVASTPGKGTAITVRLPFEPPPLRAAGD
jgi:signal transduction histidine kinase